MKVPVTYSDRHAERLEVRKINNEIAELEAFNLAILKWAGLFLLGLVLLMVLILAP